MLCVSASRATNHTPQGLLTLQVSVSPQSRCARTLCLERSRTAQQRSRDTVSCGHEVTFVYVRSYGEEVMYVVHHKKVIIASRKSRSHLWSGAVLTTLRQASTQKKRAMK